MQIRQSANEEKRDSLEQGDDVRGHNTVYQMSTEIAVTILRDPTPLGGKMIHLMQSCGGLP